MKSKKKRVFFNFRLFDGIRDQLQDKRIILTDGERIERIDDEASRKNLGGYEPIDLKGLTLLPGFIDAHIHITVPFIFVVNLKAMMQMGKQLEKNFENCVKYGVTTVRDVASFPKKIESMRKRVDAARIAGPRVLTAKSFITSKDGVPEMAPTLNPVEAFIAGGQFVERLSTPDEIRRVANSLVDQKADWLKTQYSEQSFLYHGRLSNLSDECYAALMEVARQRGVRVAMHHTEVVGFKKGIEVGVDSLEHCATDELDQEAVDKFVRNGMAIVPTLKVLGDVYEIDEILDWLNGDGREDFMPEPFRQSINGIELLKSKSYPPSDYMDKYYPDIDFFRSGYPVALKNIERIKKAGGTIGVGTDTCGTGLSFFGSYWKELFHLTRAGFSNAEALRAATSVNAEIIGMKESVGSIEPDKYADFTIIDGNPLEDIERIKDVRIVIKGGEIIHQHIQ
jgi:imidazolonepropionase-like amidohydrolase